MPAAGSAEREARAAERAALLRWAATELGLDELATRDVSWDHAASYVLAVLPGADDLPGADGPPVAFVKCHRHPRKFRQEHVALRTWAPRLEGTPRLVAHRTAAPSALLLSALPGTPAHRMPADHRQQTALHHAAGRWLRALHDLPFTDQDALPVADALQRRLDGWARRAGAHVPAATIAWLRRMLRDLDLGSVSRVPCHADYGPRNWLWDARTGLAVIDFEHARPDVWLVDVHRLIDGPWQRRPGLEEAFWDGYGRMPDERETALVTAMRAMYALGTVAWARAHDDAAFESGGWRVLRRLRAPGV